MRSDSDEKYVVDLVSNILDEKYEWQKRFDTLLGDQGKQGRRNKLPVDAFSMIQILLLSIRKSNIL